MIFQRAILFAFTLLASACVSTSQLTYFPNDEFTTEAPTYISGRAKEYRLQPRDVLSVIIKTLDEETSDYFNIQPSGNGNLQLNPASLYLFGYSIDDNGRITLPEVGEVEVSGLTVAQAQEVIEQAVSRYVNNATILVKLISFKVTVLGEVASPGYYYVYNDQATVLEVLGLAGDVTELGNRENITLVRQTASGKEAILLNLKDPEMLSSTYYFLQPNDVLYVQPLSAKATRGNLNALTIVSIVISAVSATIGVLNYARPSN